VAFWVFDMIAPDGTVFPNHHVYTVVQPESRIDYKLHWGENGPKHADAWVTFEESGGQTRVTLGMALATAEEYANAKSFGAVELGLQTLGKLALGVADLGQAGAVCRGRVRPVKDRKTTAPCCGAAGCCGGWTGWHGARRWWRPHPCVRALCARPRPPRARCAGRQWDQ
jgi:hypothetical protein